MSGKSDNVPVTTAAAIEVMAYALRAGNTPNVEGATAALRALLAAGWRVMPPPTELERTMMDEGLI